jgi:hypothetical protein
LVLHAKKRSALLKPITEDGKNKLKHAKKEAQLKSISDWTSFPQHLKHTLLYRNDFIFQTLLAYADCTCDA